jgi:hypothetical protein
MGIYLCDLSPVSIWLFFFFGFIVPLSVGFHWGNQHGLGGGNLQELGMDLLTLICRNNLGYWLLIP